MFQSTIDQARAFLHAGNGAQALACLEEILQQEKEQRFPDTSVAFYLHVWALASSGFYYRASELLFPTLSSEENTENSECARALQGSDQRRKAPVWLCLGLRAHTMDVEHAMSHYRKCISALEERRMNLPLMHSRALLQCGHLHLSHNAFAAALDAYVISHCTWHWL